MDKNKLLEENSFLFSANAIFVEELYAQYLRDNLSVDKTWQEFFSKFSNDDFKESSQRYKKANVILNVQGEFHDQAQSKAQNENSNYNKHQITEANITSLAARANNLIEAYRNRGHFLVKLDPLALEILPTLKDLKLSLEDFEINSSELNSAIELPNEVAGHKKFTLAFLLDILKKAYAGRVALETSHIYDNEQKSWLYKELEKITIEPLFNQAQKKKTLQNLIEVESFEQYLHMKFPGAKRFSIEGGDSSVIAMIGAIDFAAEQEVENIVIGMAHRGRLTTLTKVLKKPFSAIMSEFKGNSAFPQELGISGDVKYHMGYSSTRTSNSGKVINLSLAPNPSHLEAVNSVVAGKVRAKQDLLGDKTRQKSMAILVHGDAAFAGQGVVAETLMMSSLKPYTINGTIHFVVNNQVGYTANPQDTHAGRYTTDMAKIIDAPILHVNGDDPEAVLFATKLAVNYRNKFGKDIIIDIICYRKYGHNEGDEPMFTQGLMYNVIKNKKTPGQIYASKLEVEGIIKINEFEEAKTKFKSFLDEQFEQSKDFKPEENYLNNNWEGFVKPKTSNEEDIKTGLDIVKLKSLGNKLCEVPEKFNINSKLQKLLKDRKQAIEQEAEIDWATAEQLAYASLLTEKFNIRITGQDAGRGTFSHRHSVFHDQENASKYVPLNNLSIDQAKFEVADSNLSEYGVLGFEYGYSTESPQNLVIWEAQFGDFANGAQIMFDQFIAAAEMKWMQMSGLVCLLPHGYEGQGPEHSSARLERFLQLSAEDNMQVVNPTLPSSFFHLIRRQMLRNFRKPLIVMSPKSLLRHKLAVSKLADLTTGTYFKPVIDEVNLNIKPEQVKRIIICSGKIYYDLFEAREAANPNNVAIIRLEQYYPFPMNELKEILSKYASVQEVIWAQEEPENMGASSFIQPYIKQVLSSINYKGKELQYIGRPASASTAVGYLNRHNVEQSAIINKSLNLGEKNV